MLGGVATMIDAPPTPWFRDSQSPTDRSRPLLFCLPYAGGGSTIYRGWQTILQDEFQVVPVCLPGREHRIDENPVFTAADVSAAMTERAGDQPYAVFGHSMGGRLAFESTRITQARGGPLPGLVVVSAARPPQSLPDGPLDQVSRLTDQRLVSRLRRAGSIPEQILDEPELLELFLPTLRADFAWIEETFATTVEPIAAPILTVSGSHDHVADPGQMSGWSQWTTATWSEVVVAGDHFFVDADAAAVCGGIRKAWADRSAETAGPDRTGPADGRPERREPEDEAPFHVRVGAGAAWADVLVRSTMLPADELDRLIDESACALAEEVLDAGTRGDGPRRRLVEHLATPVPGIQAVATDPRLREALAWQNPAVLDSARRLADPTVPTSRRGRREAMIARYWQRYAAKNETIGFFGPVTWARIDPGAPVSTASAGPHLVRSRRVCFEGWAIRAVADAVLGTTQGRAVQVPQISPLFEVDTAVGTCARPPRPAETLTDDEIAVLRLVDGRRTGAAIAAASGLTPSRARESLDGLSRRRVLRWPSDIAPDPWAHARMTELLEHLPQGQVTQHARAVWQQLLGGLEAVSRAAGDTDALIAAGAELESLFTEVTGGSAQRRPGEMYVGRRIFYEDTARDIDIVLGADALAPLDDVLPPLRQAARWWCAELAERYTRAMEGLCEDLAVDDSGIPLEELFYLVVGLLFGPQARIAADATADFAQRWAGVLDLPPDGVDHVRIDVDEFARRVRAAFPDRRTDWASARIHSPDVQLLAASMEEINRGEAGVVLGELHAGWATLDVAAFHPFHPSPERLRRGLADDCGRRRPRLSFPPTWPRATTRTTQVLLDDLDVEFVWDDDSGADPEREIVIREARVVPGPHGWRVHPTRPHPHAPESGWSLIDVFSDMVTVHAVDGFKQMATGAYVPRVSVGRAVLVRRRWQMSAEETGLGRATSRADRFLAARRLRRVHGLPEQVYVSVQGETKPVYCDLRSPVYVQGLGTMVASAAERAQGEVTVTFSEALPHPGQAWLPDAQGRRYFSEIRMQLVDQEVGR